MDKNAYIERHMSSAHVKVQDIAQLALELGLSTREALCLRAQDIDFDNSVCRVRAWNDGQVRHVPLSPKAQHILRSLKNSSDAAAE